jgi:hypothetical protein
MDDLIELLAEDSHKGWAEEKQRQGYADHVFRFVGRTRHGEEFCGADGCFKPKAKHHTDMLPYAELPEHIKEYDRVTVRGVLAGIARHGYRLVKAD